MIGTSLRQLHELFLFRTESYHHALDVWVCVYTLSWDAPHARGTASRDRIALDGGVLWQEAM